MHHLVSSGLIQYWAFRMVLFGKQIENRGNVEDLRITYYDDFNEEEQFAKISLEQFDDLIHVYFLFMLIAVISLLMEIFIFKQYFWKILLHLNLYKNEIILNKQE